MTAIRLGAFILLATLAATQQTAPSKSAESIVREPKLPVIDHDDACPAKGHIVPHVKIERDDKVYSSWQDKRVLVGTLKAGEEVTVLAGVNIVREPDMVLVVQPKLYLPLKPGDVILRYGHDRDWDWRFWAKGVWFTERIDQVLEKNTPCDLPDKSGCDDTVIKNGVKEWWVQVKRRNGHSGWVLAAKIAHDKSWINRAFDGLCADDEGD